LLLLLLLLLPVPVPFCLSSDTDAFFVCHSERSEESRKTHTSKSLPDISTRNLPALVFGITAGL
jgi:hypothetical protein